MPATKAIEKKVSNKFMLPTEINEPSDNLLDYFGLIFGRKNIGNSTFGASFPDSINFQTERGRKNLPLLMVPRRGEPALTFKSMKGYLDDFCSNSDFQVGVIDTLDAWYDLVYRHVCEMYGVNEAQGPEIWNEIKHTVDDFIAQVQDAGKVLWFISHEKKQKHDNADGTVIERIEPSCTGQAIAVVQRYCDFVFHYDWCNNERVMTIRNTDNLIWTACGRDDMFLDVDGNALKRIRIPNDPEAGFNTLCMAFEGELRDYDWQPPKKPVSSPQKKPVKKGIKK